MATLTVPIQFKRGAESGIPTLLSGEPGWTTDTHHLYVGDGSANHLIGAGSIPYFVQVNDVTVSGTAAETTLIHGGGPITIPGANVAVGSIFRVFANGLLDLPGDGAGVLKKSQNIISISNHSGLDQIEITGHGFLDGQQVIIDGVVTETGANGTWFITVIDSDHFDLQGSTFAHTDNTGTATAVGESLDINLYVGGGLACTWPIGGGISIVGGGWTIDVGLTVRGSSGVAGGLFSSEGLANGSANGTFSSTVASDLDITDLTATFGSAAVANSITCSQLWVKNG